MLVCISEWWQASSVLFFFELIQACLCLIVLNSDFFVRDKLAYFLLFLVFRLLLQQIFLIMNLQVNLNLMNSLVFFLDLFYIAFRRNFSVFWSQRVVSAMHRWSKIMSLYVLKAYVIYVLSLFDIGQKFIQAQNSLKFTFFTYRIEFEQQYQFSIIQNSN